MSDNRCALLEIGQKMPGYHRFIGSWVCRGTRTFLIDVGPANSVDTLLETLEDWGVDRVDYILLTHIHLDHAGGVAQVLDRFPMARAVCHTKGVDHLVDPTQLWEGSLKVLKERAEAFGRPQGVDRDRMIAHDEIRMRGVTVIETPGHAPHHLSFSYQGCLFAGEAAGNYYSSNGADYLRPATPPRLFLETFLESVDRLLDLEDQRICYGHFGEAASSRQMLRRFRSQILRWEETIKREASRKSDDLVARCVHVLLESDPDLDAYHRMHPIVQDRERYFLANSVRGFLGYLKEKGVRSAR